jgi:hypothetical protein
MKTIKLPKFEWSRIDGENIGHTKNEWGQQTKSTKTKIEDGLL